MQRAKGGKPAATSGAAVRRYFPGKAPEESRADLSGSESDDGRGGAATLAQKIAIPALTAVHVGDADADLQAEGEQGGQTDALLRDRLLARRQASSDSSSDEGDSHRRAQARLVHRTRDIHSPRQPDDGAGSCSASGSSGSASDSDEDDGYALPILLKPSFVPKSQRQAATQGRSLVASSSLSGGGDGDGDGDGDTAADASEAQENERRAVSVRKAAEEALRARAEPPVDESNEAVLCDNDDGDVDAEFEAWRERELRRIERDEAEKLAAEQEEAERAQVRDMAEEEREAAGLVRARQQRAEKAQLVDSLAAAAAADPAAVRNSAQQAATDANARATQAMLEHALRADQPRRGNSKWRGYRAEDTSQGHSPWGQHRRNPRPT